jgi:hypothetical protein
MYVKVKDSNFVRDTNSMGLINTDYSSREEYYNKVRLFKSQKEQINNMNKEISDLKTDISEIKQLILKLTEKNNG